MELGGNEKAREYFKTHGIQDFEILKKYYYTLLTHFCVQLILLCYSSIKFDTMKTTFLLFFGCFFFLTNDAPAHGEPELFPINISPYGS